jgi:hypothetical protein
MKSHFTGGFKPCQSEPNHSLIKDERGQKTNKSTEFRIPGQDGLKTLFDKTFDEKQR